VQRTKFSARLSVASKCGSGLVSTGGGNGRARVLF